MRILISRLMLILFTSLSSYLGTLIIDHLASFSFPLLLCLPALSHLFPIYMCSLLAQPPPSFSCARCNNRSFSDHCNTHIKYYQPTFVPRPPGNAVVNLTAWMQKKVTKVQDTRHKGPTILNISYMTSN
jgi:hypothetical protein